MGTLIDYADIKVGDTIRITLTPDPEKPIVQEGVVGKECYSNRYGKAFDFVGDEHISNDIDAGWTQTVELINRPEPPKPAAKVGDKLTVAVAEPPIGSIMARSIYGGGTKARLREVLGWRLIYGDDYADTIEWTTVVLADYTLAFLPSE